MKYEGKVILVSGASSGIGRSLVLNLSKKNCKLAIFARREKRLEKISKEVEKNGSEIIYKKCDVTDKKQVKQAIEFTIKKYGRIDIAFLNAGVLIPNPIQTFSSEPVIKSIHINYFAKVYFIENLLKIMKKQKGGTIAVTSTLPDARGLPGWSSYGGSKSAISWLVESLRSEAKQKYNIKFITIKPGAVETEMIAGYSRQGSISSDKAANIILKGVRKGKSVIQFPIFQVVPQRLSDLFPPFAYDMQSIEILKGRDFPEPKEE